MSSYQITPWEGSDHRFRILVGRSDGGRCSHLFHPASDIVDEVALSTTSRSLQKLEA